MKATSIIALDVGEKRIGIATAYTEAGFPQPLITLNNDDRFWDNLNAIIDEHNVSEIVVGLPRNLNSDDTTQTLYTRDFIVTLQQKFKLPVKVQDEAGTSRQAVQELLSKKKKYLKADIDALAATYILEDFLLSERGN